MAGFVVPPRRATSSRVSRPYPDSSSTASVASSTAASINGSRGRPTRGPLLTSSDAGCTRAEYRHGCSYIPARNIIDVEVGVSDLGAQSVYSLRCRVMFALRRSLLVQVDQVTEAVGKDGFDAAVVH